MLTNEEIQKLLPDGSFVIARLLTAVLVKHSVGDFPFATYRVGDDGACSHGRAFGTHNAAVEDLIARV
jgi:hypothetical protein